MDRANSRSRANWRDLMTNLTCETDYFLCGVEIFLDGKFDIENEPLEMKSQTFSESLEEEPLNFFTKPQYSISILL